MPLCLARETLLKPLQLVIGVVDRKHIQPILSNVLLDTQNQQLSITATDLEIELISHISLDGAPPLDSSYRLTLPARKLFDICRALPDNASIELSMEKERVTLRSGASRFTLATLPAENFPNMTIPPNDCEFTLPAQQFFHLLQRTAFAMAQEDVRYYLNGVLFEIIGNTLCVVATDGHRLAKNSVSLESPISQTARVIIPHKAVLELSRLLSDNLDPVRIDIGHNHFHAFNPCFKFTTKLIEGRFPDYDRVIPKINDKQFTIDRDHLKQALTRTAILCNEKFKGVHLELRNNLLRLSANNPEQEMAEEELPILYTHHDLNMGFNVRYLLDIVNRVDDKDLIISFSDANNGILIKENNDTYNSAFVVMPMRL